MDGVKKVKDTDITFKDGYIKPDNTGIGTSTGYVYSNPIFLTKGESIHFKTTGHGFASVAKTNDAGTSYTKIYEVTSASTGNNSSYVTTVDYTATEDITISICRKTVGVESEIPYIIRIVPTEGGYNPQFRGIKITPKNILIHSRDLNVNDSLQDYNTTDEETLHILVTIIPNYKTNYGNLAQIYCNGDKVRSFSFETADRWDVQSNVKVGAEKADVFLYKMRVYDRGFESYDALKNYINSLPSTKAKEEAKVKIEAPLDDSYKLSYDECVKNGLNTMVIEILDQDQTVPSISHPSAKQCNLWVKINNPMDGELDEDFARFFNGEMIENQTIEGQGTTAMTYARWNFRWKLDETYNKRRITAKKNFASSMHSHKMGATRLFNDLHKKIVGANDVNGRVAVFQYPVYGFQKVLVEGTTDQYIYEPIGLYTIGPDKGDKKTFGFDNKAYKNTLVHLEGTDHTPKGVGFDYPYDELGYSGSAEALGAVNASGSVVAAWEVGAAGSYDPKDDPNEVKGLLDVEFAPAYNVVERNSTYILGVTETLAEMNADIADWQARRDAEDRAFSDLEFFTDGVYDLYYFNTKTQKYETRGINMLTDLGLYASDVEGLSLEEKTELFKTKRRERFVALWETYWHKNDAIFHYAFILLLGATDNFKKNTYPYKFKAVSEGGKYRWRQDDLDTLFDINNQGLAAKIYSILVGDKTATGSGSIYRGDTSVFWSLIRECFGVEIKAMVHAIFDAMVELSPYGNNPLEKLVGCIRYYFWDKAQAYFPASAYSKDAEWTYEDTWAAGLYKEVNPLQQSLGGHKEAEMDWVTMRMLFCAMFFNYGPFGAVNDSFSDTSTGQIAYGGAGAKTYLITMACDGNPTILRGQSELVTFGKRVKAGETISLTVPNSSGADTRIYIQGVDWMEDIGDLSDLQVSADNPQLSVASKRLQRLKLGDEDASKVTTNVQALNFGDCPSMMVVDARNASSLTGTIDLSKMPRLMEAYFGGTGVKAVNVPNGSKIAVLELGEETTQISLMNLKFMELEGFRYSELPKLEFLRIENCSQLNPFTMLKSIYNTDGNVIRDIRIIGFDVDGDASDVTMIANLANDVDKDGNPHIYNGIDADGKPMDNSHPIIEGRLRVNGNIYKEDYEALKAVFANLAMEFLGFYVSFKDPEVLRILLEKITTDDGVGLTTEDVEKVTSIGTWFRANTLIETFNEFERFTGLTSLNDTYNTNYGPFNGCTSLKSVSIPPSVTYIGGGAFQGCTVLEDVGDLSNVKTIHNSSFTDTPALAIDVEMPKLTSMLGSSFLRSGITKFSAPLLQTIPAGGLTNNGAFTSCVNLTEVDIPLASSIGKAAFASCTLLGKVEIDTENCTLIGDSAFYSCTSLSFDELNLPNLTSLGQNAFYGVKIKKLNLGALKTLPDGSSATNYGDKSVLEEITLSKDLTSIPRYSFQGYTALAKVNIPENNVIKSILYDAFRGTTAMDVDLVFPILTEIGQRAFDASGIRSLSCPELLTIATQRDGRGTFQGCTNFKHIDMPKVTYIGGRAFQGCSSLGEGEDLSLPMLGGEVGMAAFRYTLYERVVDLGGITSTGYAASLGEGAFANMPNLKFIKFPSTVTSLGRSTCYGCTALEMVVCEAVTPPSFNAVFDSTNSTFVIYVPDESVEAYKTATNWSQFSDRIYPMSVYDNGGAENLITFADPAVEAICVANWDNGDGCFMKSEAEAVTSIGTWFSGNTVIETFDELGRFVNVTKLDRAAFQNCTSLKSIDISRMVELGTYALNGCIALEYDVLSLRNLTTIGQYGLGNVKIRRLEVPNLVSYISGNNNISTWGDRDLLQEIMLSSNITSLNDRMFYKHTALRLVEGVDWSKITTIGTLVFYNCTALEFDELNLPRLTSLGQDAFYGVKIKKLVFEKLTTLPTIYSNTTENYGDKEVLEEVVFAEGMTTIPPASFRDYTKLTKVGFPQTLTTIEGNAFYNTSLYDEEVTLENLTTIVGAAFAKTGIKSFVAPNLEVIPVNDAYYGGLFQDCKNLVSVEVDNVTSIGTVAFRGCSALERVKFSDDITDIGTAVFFGCPNLVGDFVLNSLTTIGKGAFSGTAITSFVANSLTSIPDADATFGGTFHNCTALAKVELGEVTYIGTQSFRNCTGLESIVLRALTPPTLASNAFMGASTTFVIYVPDASVEAYKTASNWSTYASRIYPMSVYENGGAENLITFADPAVEAIVLANWDTNKSGYMSKNECAAVKDTGGAFQNKSEIISFNEFENFTGVELIGSTNYETEGTARFINCTNLESIRLPKSLKTIKGYSFKGCSKLKTNSLPVSLTYIGNNAFIGCDLDGLIVDVPNLTTLGNGAFAQTNIVRVENVGSITVVGTSTGNHEFNGIFRACKELEFVRLPSTVTYLGVSTFYKCSALKEIVCEATTPPTLYATQVFEGTHTELAIYVPDEAVDTYKTATNWSQFASRIKPLSEYNG